jgi:hypothetical protein
MQPVRYNDADLPVAQLDRALRSESGAGNAKKSIS